MKKIVFICLVLFIPLVQLHAAQKRETLALDASGCSALRIESGAGYLNVQGKDGMGRIEVSATLHVRGINDTELREFKSTHVTLKLEKIGSKAVLIASIDEKFSLDRLFGMRDASIDLDVSLPRGLALEIEDGSGDINVRTMGNGLELVDGSGDVRVAGITGTVEIEDGSGDLLLADLKGRVEIEDGSGNLELKDAGGDVSITDGSGQLEIFRVKGSLRIEDGSGDIVIDGVEKDVTIEEAGSGGVEIRNVKGQVRK